jgi:hypothetical protein
MADNGITHYAPCVIIPFHQFPYTYQIDSNFLVFPTRLPTNCGILPPILHLQPLAYIEENCCMFTSQVSHSETSISD